MVQGKVFVVTGADGGLGSAVTARLASSGAQLVLSTFHKEPGVRLASQIRAEGGEAWAHDGDLTDPAISQALSECVRSLGAGLDGVVHTVGGFAMGDAVHQSPDTVWAKMMQMNLFSALAVARACVPLMQASGGGSIVHIGAQAALGGAAQMGAYCASKSALIRATESMARELARDRIRANTILPDIIDTPANRQAMPEADPGDWVTPASIAEVIAFLLSGASADITGASIPVCGRVGG